MIFLNGMLVLSGEIYWQQMQNSSGAKDGIKVTFRTSSVFGPVRLRDAQQQVGEAIAHNKVTWITPNPAINKPWTVSLDDLSNLVPELKHASWARGYVYVTPELEQLNEASDLTNIHSANMAFYITEETCRASNSRVVISLHGIRTRGKWQKDITPTLAKEGFIPHPIDYGYFPALFFLLPFLRSRKREWFNREYEAIVKQHSDSSPNIIAHSFGSYLVARTMDKYSEIKFSKIIFCGTLVRRDYPWIRRFDNGRVNTLLNEYGGMDFWAWIATFIVKDAGQSGYRGFCEKDVRLVDFYYEEYSHSDYFHALHFERVWIPFLKGIPLTARVPEPPQKTNWRFLLTIIFAFVVLVICATYCATVTTRSKQDTIPNNSLGSQQENVRQYNPVNSASLPSTNKRSIPENAVPASGILRIDDNLLCGDDVHYVSTGNFGGIMSEVKYIVLHRSEVPSLPVTISGSQSFRSVSVHIVVSEDGAIVQIVPLNMIAFHCHQFNPFAIGIQITGKSGAELPKMQMERLVKLLKVLLIQYPKSSIQLHKNLVNTTDCPGANFPIDEIRKQVGVQ